MREGAPSGEAFSMGDRLNWRLIVGVLLTVGLAVVAVAGPALAPYDKSYSEKIVTRWEGERIVDMRFPPQPPSAEHPFGTDRWGYDILSLMLYGARYTLVAALGVALVRLLLATAIGAGLGMSSLGRVGELMGAAGGVPAFLVVYFLIRGVTMNSPLSVAALFALQGGVMALVGVPGLVGVLSARVGSLREHSHVVAAESLGAARPRLLGRHILPFLRQELSVLVLGEAVLVLNLIGQLGLFHLFLGGTIFTLDPPVYTSRTSEWAGILGDARGAVMTAPWVVIFPLLGFLLAILAMFFLMRGLELRYRRRSRRAVLG